MDGEGAHLQAEFKALPLASAGTEVPTNLRLLVRYYSLGSHHSGYKVLRRYIIMLASPFPRHQSL